MKSFYVSAAAAHADDPRQREIQSTFLVVSKQLKPKRSGGDYLAVMLCDRTGQIEAKMWDNIGQYVNAFDTDDVVNIKGYLNRYNGRPQLILQTVTRMDPDGVDFTDFLPKTDQDIDQLWSRLLELTATVGNPHLQALLQAFLQDSAFAAAFRQAPAAKTLHHAYIGGLLEHVVSLLELCDPICRHYPLLDRDLVIAGVFLHDIGKIHELCFARSFAYTTRGQLLGHMVIELEMIRQKIQEIPGFPEELKVLLEHLMISHHGQYEFGSPKLPMFPEALILHYLDDLDSKMASMRAQYERENGGANFWTGFNPSLGRSLLDLRKYLGSAAKPEAPGGTASGTE